MNADKNARMELTKAPEIVAAQRFTNLLGWVRGFEPPAPRATV